MLDIATYKLERDICAKAEAYASQFRKRNGGWVMTAEQAMHPDYVACDNAMRGRVEQFEILRDNPASLLAYCTFHKREIASRFSEARTQHPGRGDQVRVTVWTGDLLGIGQVNAVWNSNFGDRRASFQCSIGGAAYAGTAFLSSGDYCRLRRVKT